MPNKIKHSIETRKFICAMYNMGRERNIQDDRYKGTYTKGRYSLKEIERLTGVNHKVVWNIANGRV